mmetsp:Transcript_3325/g.6383  ORF Transcript_3325/g.6383 Transcript_3325/m.6383 type:complete len:528 (+) Transcript_3325:88-1671(+)
MSAPAPPQSPFEALPRYIATSILSYVTSDDWLNFRLSSRTSFETVHGASTTTNVGDEESESLWRLALVRDYQFRETDDVDYLHRTIKIDDSRSDAFLSTDNVFTASNSFESWKNWRKIDLRVHHRRERGCQCVPTSEKIVGPYFLRAASMWSKIEQWCDDEARSNTLGWEIKTSLMPGRPLDPLSHEDARTRVPNAQTSALKAVYAFYSGQSDPRISASLGDRRRRHYNPFRGLFGGFQAYHIVSSTMWMEPEFGGFGRPEQEPLESDDEDSPYLIIAQGEAKVMVMDLGSGQVYFLSEGNAGTKLLATERTTTLDGRDSILRWFEEHANRLHRDFYTVGEIVTNNPSQTLSSLMRYPALADTVNCSHAVTRGVELVASAIFVPEMGIFVYSIRMRLLAPEDGEGYMSPDERGFDTCQLLSRHWRVGKCPPDADEPLVEEVRGEGVIGSYPLLHEGRYVNYEDVGASRLREKHGSGYFSYQSCSEAKWPGFIEGSLQFRPGSLAEPNGEVFDVRVARFPLNFSQFLY